MKRSLSPRLTSLALLACISLAPGCGKESVKLTPVTGKVTLNGQPVTSGQVSLIPLSKEDKVPGLMTGAIDSAGSYKISTAGKDGAPLGKYKVTVTPSTMPAPAGQKGPAASIPPIYMDPSKSTLSVEVIENPAADRYDLKLTK